MEEGKIRVGKGEGEGKGKEKQEQAAFLADRRDSSYSLWLGRETEAAAQGK